VLVLGTSLGAVDAALLLHNTDPHANVVLASKRGRLPAVKAELTEYSYSKLAPEEVDKIRGEKGRFGVSDVDTLVKNELLESYPDVASAHFFNLPLEDDAVALFEHEVDELQKGNALWQRFQFGWINIADYLWKAMETEADKRKFQNYYTSCILTPSLQSKKKKKSFDCDKDIHRFTSSFHIDIALKVRDWLRAGTLRLASIPDPTTLVYNNNENEFTAQLSFCGSQEKALQETHFDAVVDASGVSKKFAEASLLFRNLREKVIL
jgi:uncharacterized NAD(P)/FAD-binding protein YdhS